MSHSSSSQGHFSPHGRGFSLQGANDLGLGKADAQMGQGAFTAVSKALKTLEHQSTDFECKVRSGRPCEAVWILLAFRCILFFRISFFWPLCSFVLLGSPGFCPVISACAGIASHSRLRAGYPGRWYLGGAQSHGMPWTHVTCVRNISQLEGHSIFC